MKVVKKRRTDEQNDEWSKKIGTNVDKGESKSSGAVGSRHKGRQEAKGELKHSIKIDQK